jgi:hypothetical protein
MVIQSTTAFWIIATLSFVAAIVIGLLGLLCAAAGFIILRDRGYGTIRSALAIGSVLFALSGVVFWAIFQTIPDGPSPPTDLLPIVLVTVSAAVLAVAGVLCWGVARKVPETPRRDGGPQRRLRYRAWGIVIGWATVPLAIVLWRADGWTQAIRAPVVTLPAMYALFVLESRARNRVPEDAELGIFVLSLRGFPDDFKQTIHAKPGETQWAQTGNRERVNLEQFITDAVQARVGRMIAFGSPRDKLPAGGAGRVYAPEDSWQTKVTELAEAARAIVMQIGESPSLAEELGIIMRNGLATKLFVLTPPPGRSGRVVPAFYRLLSRLVGWPEPTWSGFAELLRANSFDAGGGDPGPGAVITFDERLRRVDLRQGCRTPDDYAMAIARRLEAVEPQP